MTPQNFKSDLKNSSNCKGGKIKYGFSLGRFSYADFFRSYSAFGQMDGAVSP